MTHLLAEAGVQYEVNQYVLIVLLSAFLMIVAQLSPSGRLQRRREVDDEEND